MRTLFYRYYQLQSAFDMAAQSAASASGQYRMDSSMRDMLKTRIIAASV